MSSLLRRASILLLAATILLGLGATASPAEESPSPPAGPLTLRIGWTNDLTSLNLFLGGLSPSDFEAYQLNYDFLVGFDAATLDPKPALATSWSVSDDGLVWTFELRRDVTWSDGEAFTAEDVAFTINFIVEQGANFYSSNVMFIDEAVAIDDDTVQVRCTDPKADMLGTGLLILPEHIWSKVGMKAAFSKFQNPAPIVGTGPFQVVEWKRGDYVRMQANKSYWGGAPTVDELLFTYYTNPDSMVYDLESGKQDVIVNVPEAQFEKLSQDSKIATIAANQGFVEQLFFNCYQDGASKGAPVLRDPAFRRALNFAVDKKKLVTLGFSDLAISGTTVIPPGYTAFPWHWDPGAEAFPFDLEMAAAALDEAGYTDGDGDGVREADGKPISLHLLARSQSPGEQRAAKLIAGWFEDIGIDVKLSVVDEGVYLDTIYNVNEAGDLAPDFDMLLYWTGSGPDPGMTLGFETSDQIGWWSVAYWGSKDYDDLWDEQSTTIDRQARKAIVWEMQKLVNDESPYITIVDTRVLQAYRADDWTGWVTSPVDGGVVMTWYSHDTYVNLKPSEAEAVEAGSSWMLPVVLVVVGIAAVAVVAILLVRRRGRKSVEVE